MPKLCITKCHHSYGPRLHTVFAVTERRVNSVKPEYRQPQLTTTPIMELPTKAWPSVRMPSLQIPWMEKMVENKTVYYATTAFLALGSGVLLYKFLIRHYDQHRRYGIPGPGSWPLVGNMRDLMKEGFVNYDKNLVEKYGKVVGYYIGRRPALVIADMDILKEVIIKHFDKFCDRSPRNTQAYPIRKMMTVLESDHWRHVRNNVSPSFSGGKLRRMVPGLNQCGRIMVRRLLENCEKDQAVEMKEASGKFSMNAIASLTFGIDIDSDEDNERFVTMGNKFMGSLGQLRGLKIFLLLTFPWLTKFVTISFFPDDCMDFFLGVFSEVLKRKQQENLSLSPKDSATKRNFLDLMAELHIEDPKESDFKGNEDFVKSNKGHIFSKKGLTHEEILAQGLIFFLAGFDTVSTCISFLAYNLAVNPEVQDKVYTEIREVLGDKTEPDYDLVKKMTYLHMCVEESLRMYPPAFRTDRLCNEDIEINGLKIHKGTIVVIPNLFLHHSPEIWSEPEKFIPERFIEEEKAARHPMAHMPFGLGPRHCIAMRLALVEVKFAIVHMLLNFRLITCEETQIPVVVHKMRMMGEKGLNIKLMAR